jgi:tRNA A37 threonylcarbamoyladenosine dehydratase
VNEAFSRTLPLLGEKAMARLAAAKVLVVGVGGVGGWCAEALVRSGVGSITLMDDDVVAPSNLNRQCAATSGSVGEVKVEAMKARLESINPSCDIQAWNERFTEEGDERLARFDLVVDAIDSVDCKAALILGGRHHSVKIISSMGAALRLDPLKVTVSDFSKVEGDGLARALRNRFKRLKQNPGRFRCVWSREAPAKISERGSLMTVTAVFGMSLAAEALKIIADE